MTSTSINDKALELYVGAKTRTLSLRDEEGQVAAEYMGLVALAAFIIFALITTTDIDTKISQTVERLVGAIAKGENPAQ
jgi:Flp pilus assembly pilin Flp